MAKGCKKYSTGKLNVGNKSWSKRAMQTKTAAASQILFLMLSKNTGRD